MIHVSYALYDARGTFSKFLGTSIWSLLTHTSSQVTIHLLHDNTLSQENRQKFVSCVMKFGQTIIFYNVEEIACDKINFLHEHLEKTLQSRFSIAAFYRLFLNSVLPDYVKRVIYLDADTLPVLDIKELWEEDTGESGIAAVAEYDNTEEHFPKWVCDNGGLDYHRYFNSGVLLIERNGVFSDHKLLEKSVLFLERHPECGFVDQDALNSFYGNVYRKLPLKYNVFVPVRRYKGIKCIEPAIYHFDSGSLGMFVQDDIYDRLFYQTFMQTPWCDVDFLMRTFHLVEMVHDQQKILIQQASNQAAHRQRVFCGAAEDWEAIADIFSCQGNDEFVEIISTNGKVDEKLLLTCMRQKKGKAIFLIFVPQFAPVSYCLQQHGFYENDDYLDGRNYLKKEQGGLELYDPLLLRLI